MNHMIIKDMLTGHAHEYGTNPHDSLIVSEDGRSLTYYNLQNGDGSRFGDYRFVGDDHEGYWNIGGVSIFVPERKRGKWIRKTFEDWWCNQCGNEICTETPENYHYCPSCGSYNGGDEE